MKLEKEEIVLSSNDGSITLTTHRVLQKTSDINKEILLEDVVSQEVIEKKHRYYIILSWVLGIPALILFFVYLSNNSPFYRRTQNKIMPFLITFSILTLISLFCLFTIKEKFLRIRGKYNYIDFSIKNLSQSSLYKFQNNLTVESDNRKRGQ